MGRKKNQLIGVQFKKNWMKNFNIFLYPQKYNSGKAEAMQDYFICNA